MGRKSRGMEVVFYYEYPDGHRVLYSSLSEEEKQRIAAEQAERLRKIMTEYYRTHIKSVEEWERVTADYEDA